MIDLTLEQHVHILLEQFDVPDIKRNVEKKTNVRWLLRNISVKNKDHDNLAHMKTCLKALLSGGKDR
jgi:hypothetical protein